MPLPLIPIILGGASVVAAAHGVKKGFEAKDSMDAANTYARWAKDIAKEAEQEITQGKEKTTKEIEALGAQKITTLSGSVHDFVTTFEQIKNVQLEDSTGLDEIKHFNPQSPEFLELKKVSMEAREVAINGIGAIGGGALLAYGTYNVVMSGLGGLLVTATTGTALTSLSGVAATNATLAWLGGGALSAGGLGMAGGMAVLGGLVAGPALALGGTLFAKKAEQAYWDAMSNYEEAKTFAEQAKNICSVLKMIEERAKQLRTLLVDLDKVFVDLNAVMRYVVNRNGTDWNDYQETDKRQIYKCVQVAQVVKMVLDTALLTEEGNLREESQKTLEAGKDFLESLSV